MSQVIADVLRPALSHRPAAPAVVARSGTLTYADLDRAAAAAAGAMWEFGVRPGDRVAACLPNDVDEFPVNAMGKIIRTSLPGLLQGARLQ